MADKNIKIKVTTEADTKDVEDLSNRIKKIDNSKVKLDANVDSSKVDALEKKVSDLKNQKLQQKLELDTSKLDEANRKIQGIKTFLDMVKNGANIPFNVDDADIKKAEKELKDLQSSKAELELKVADSELKIAKKEVDDLKGEKIDIDLEVDDTSLKNAKKEVDDLGDRLQSSLGSTESAITGVIAGMAGKSIWDTIYGTSKRAETNKILLKNMADTTVAYDDLYNKIDKTTDQSLISMQSLIPALNGIKAATGSTGETINNVTPGVAAFGQYVLALTGSEAKAESAMFDLSKGIKGLYASLDQYGITEDALMRTGLWSGKEDDVEGYIAAVNACTGSTDELMSSTQGLEALMGKAFSRGGKRIGEDLLPMVKQALNGFINLDAATDGWLSTMLLIGGGALSGFATFLATAGQVINGVKMIRDAYIALRDAEILEGIAGWFSISWMLAVIAIGITLGLLFIYLYNNCDEFRQAIDWLGQSLQWLAGVAFQELVNLLNYVQNLGQQVLASVGVTSNDITATIVGFLVFFSTLPLQILLYLNNILGHALGFKGSFTDYLIKTAMDSVNGFMRYISSLPGRFLGELNKMLGYARDFLVQLPATLKNAAINVVKGWIFGTGEHSPGFMYDAFTGELEAMEEAPLLYEGNLVRNITRMGSNMFSSFNSKTTGVDVVDNITGNLELSNNTEDSMLTELLNLLREFLLRSPQIILNLENIPNEDFVDELIEALRKELYWNNKTAGRTN